VSALVVPSEYQPDTLCRIRVERYATVRNGRIIAQSVSRRLLTRGLKFDPRSGLVGFAASKLTMEQVFLEYLDFPRQFSFDRLLHTHHLGLVQ
jgi:hypothetical protein